MEYEGGGQQGFTIILKELKDGVGGDVPPRCESWWLFWKSLSARGAELHVNPMVGCYMVWVALLGINGEDVRERYI